MEIELPILLLTKGKFLGKMTPTERQLGFTIMFINGMQMNLTKMIKYRSILIVREKILNVFCLPPEPELPNFPLITIAVQDMLQCSKIKNH